MDFSAILTVHAEGRLLVPTIRSLARCLDAAKERRIVCELVVVCDAADDGTREYLAGELSRLQVPVTVEESNAGDPGLSRNLGVSVASGRFCGFFDGDDLYSSDWIWKSVRLLEVSQGTTDLVAHPEVSWWFGSDSRVMWAADSPYLARRGTDALLNQNLWISHVIAPRALFLRFPQRTTTEVRGFEDWTWFQELTAAGVQHLTVRGCVHFVRLKPAAYSVRERSSAVGHLPHSTGLAEFLVQEQRSQESPALHSEKDNRGLTRLRSFLRSPRILVGKCRIRRADGRNGDPHWLEEQYLRLNVDVADAVAKGEMPSGHFHYERYGILEGRPKTVFDVKFPHDLTPLHDVPLDRATEAAPLWAWAHAVHQSQFESLLHPSALPTPWVWDPFQHGGWAKELASIVPFPFACDVLIAVPWLGTGGADLAAVVFAEALAEMGLKVCVLTTQGGLDAKWGQRLQSKDVTFIDGEGLNERIRGDLVLFFHYFLEVLQPKWLHVVNSHLGWQFLERYGAAWQGVLLRSVSLYCFDFDARDRPSGYALKVKTIAGNLDGVLSDNAWFLEYLSEVLGVDVRVRQRLRHPIPVIRPRYETTDAPILWASRWDRQKDLPRAIAAMRYVPYMDLDVFGRAVLDSESLHITPDSVPQNVRLMGEYQGFGELAELGYQIFLYTSRWDGLPNVVLEALGAGMTVVASRLPGLESDVPEGLIDFFDIDATPEEVAEALVRAQSNASLSRSRQAREFIASEHSEVAMALDVQRAWRALSVSA